ncbi:MAG: hypothetical protein V4723_01685 [Pseudomonadota bacterium]
MKTILLALAALAPVVGQAQEAKTCIAGLPAETRCYTGQDARGAYYWIAIPKQWNGALVVHSHGGPSMKAPAPDDSASDLKRFAVTVAEGFAWAGSSYHHAGYGVRDAAADTDRVRAIFWNRFGRPRITLLHGQSWGANVAAKAAELHGRDSGGRLVYDGMLLTSGVLAGGSRSYDMRVDLRAVYQYYCNNLPAPGEPAYPLWQGLDAATPLPAREVETRLNQCTGINLAAAQRSAAQQSALRNILAVTRLPERTLGSHLNWATTTFRDLVVRQLKGANPFTNIGVLYSGSDNDAALNQGVARFAASAQGVHELAFDSDLSGKLEIPTISIHAAGDPTVFVEGQSVFAQTVADAGASNLLVQAFTTEQEHSKLATPQYAAVLRALTDWIDKARRPSPATLAASCEEARAQYGERCYFDAGYRAAPWDTRVYPRTRPSISP